MHQMNATGSHLQCRLIVKSVTLLDHPDVIIVISATDVFYRYDGEIQAIVIRVISKLIFALLKLFLYNIYHFKDGSSLSLDEQLHRICQLSHIFSQPLLHGNRILVWTSTWIRSVPSSMATSKA